MTNPDKLRKKIKSHTETIDLLEKLLADTYARLRRDYEKLITCERNRD